MTQEDKKLLLKDLCARLPYGVVKIKIGDYSDYILQAISPIKDKPILVKLTENDKDYLVHVSLENVKPYLRSLSSMTGEERVELSLYENPIQITDFYYSHHLDGRYMIEKGLALEAPKDMYKTE